MFGILIVIGVIAGVAVGGILIAEALNNWTDLY